MKSLLWSRRLVVVALCLCFTFSILLNGVLAAPLLRFNLPNPHVLSALQESHRFNAAVVSASALRLLPVVRLSADDKHPPHQDDPANASGSPQSGEQADQNTPNKKSSNSKRSGMNNETNSPQLINALHGNSSIQNTAPPITAGDATVLSANHPRNTTDNSNVASPTSASNTTSNAPKKPRNETALAKEQEREEALISEEEDDVQFDDDDDFLGTGSVTSIFSGPRAKRVRFMKGGYIEIIEWLFVVILVAPGTFPAMGCVLYTCTNVARRRINSPHNSDGPALDSQALTNNDSRPYRTTPADLQRRSSNIDNSPRLSPVLF